MKNELYSNAAMWLSVGAAVVTAIIFTHSATPLWFFIIPFIGTVYDKVKK